MIRRIDTIMLDKAFSKSTCDGSCREESLAPEMSSLVRKNHHIFYDGMGPGRLASYQAFGMATREGLEDDCSTVVVREGFFHHHFPCHEQCEQYLRWLGRVEA